MPKPSHSLAAVIPAPGRPVELREFPIPELEPDSALLRVTCSEVCGTDVHLRDGRLAGVPYPLIPGHVSCGVLESIRGTVTDVYGKPLREGDRVTFLDVHKTCHQCWFCLVAKATTRCPLRKVYGITYGAEDGLCGGWSQFVYLKPGVHCIRLDGVPDELYMAGGCSLPTALHAVQRADIDFADCVLVLGAGPVGLSAIAFSLLRGAGRLLCIGAPDPRLAVAAKIGASAVLNFTAHDEHARRAWVLDQTGGRGADVTIECTGAPQAVTEALRFTRDAGTVVVVGQYTDHGEASFNPHLDLNKKHLDVRACWGSDYSHFHRAVEMLKSPVAAEKWSAVPLARFSLSQADQAIDAVAAGRMVKALMIPER
jgi:L-iditol 2-dehydrogenase